MNHVKEYSVECLAVQVLRAYAGQYLLDEATHVIRLRWSVVADESTHQLRLARDNESGTPVWRSFLDVLSMFSDAVVSRRMNANTTQWFLSDGSVIQAVNAVPGMYKAFTPDEVRPPTP